MRDEIDRINRIGDDSPGFVWRFQTDTGDATGVRVLSEPTVLFNLSICGLSQAPPRVVPATSEGAARDVVDYGRWTANGR